MSKRPLPGERRTFERIQAHYDIERRLADKLRYASREERTYLYSSLYEELFTGVPDHPQLTCKSSVEDRQRSLRIELKLLHPFLNNDINFVEIGPGDCALSLEVAKIVKNVVAIDVSKTITCIPDMPDNFKIILSDGVDIPLPPGSVDIMYSNQLMEHLHPDDAFLQLTNIYKCLSKGGMYICLTPNKISGPHDISKYFDDEATGFHLKEYTSHELSRILKQVGFRSIKPVTYVKGVYLHINFLALFIESIFSLLRNIGATSIVKSRLGFALLPDGLIAWK